MKLHLGRPASLGVVALAGTASLLLSAATAHAAVITNNPPPYETASGDPSAVGQIGFVDASGNPVTSGGTTDTPFAVYAIGNTVVHGGDSTAQLQLCSPVAG